MVDREFFLGFIRIHVLYHAQTEPIFGAEIARELGRHGYTITAGTLYPLLHRLQGEGYLESFPKVEQGKQRRYYRTTPKGSEMLNECRKQIRELVDEVLA
ncbi:PadR family transcriptional regulator [Dehalococcoides mccartyi]|uniref:Transcriptional regulator, PadR-type n=1 Tax=Dehalococcoides mccartyi (strain VS) TaxID=311424 RepID=D2BHP7_DEHMV|nr:PadR family transcriptional regulator [Dehalococcoides mccartyi]ACZ61847.1 transcriptional regulator, PadR-type [Dehalococcoides mccartyi VS]